MAINKLFTVTIEETVTQDFEVFTTDAGEAIDIAIEKYRAGEFVLEPCEPQFRQIAVTAPNDENTEWMEFYLDRSGAFPP